MILLHDTVDRELLDRWLTALRSGDYDQGIGVLRDSANRYCCLGVLCDVSGYGTWDGAYRLDGKIRVAILVGTRFDEVLTRVGHRALTALNDRGLGFEVIADILEEDHAGLHDTLRRLIDSDDILARQLTKISEQLAAI